MPHYIKRRHGSVDRDPNNESIFIIGINEYGYRYNINHPEIRQYHEGYKVKAGKDYSRREFEYLLDRYLFPNGLPDDERRRREVYSIIIPAMKAARK